MVKLLKNKGIKFTLIGLGIIGLVTAGLVYLNTRDNVKDVRAGWFNDPVKLLRNHGASNWS